MSHLEETILIFNQRMDTTLREKSREEFVAHLPQATKDYLRNGFAGQSFQNEV